MDLLDVLETQIVPGDGAMGTLLMERGYTLDRCLEELCVSNPEVVSRIHADYIAAGARFIETNSFGANACRLSKYGFEERVVEIAGAGARLAVEAARGSDVVVAGSVGPLGISADQAREQGIDRKMVFRDHITALLEGGISVLMLETFLDFDELLLALEVKKSVGATIPVICSLVCNPEGRLPNGMEIGDAFRALRGLGADITGANCLNGPHAMVQLFEKIPAEGLLSAFPNAGHPHRVDGRYLYFTTPEYFAASARKLVAQGARLVGGCCGTNPAHIRAMARSIESLRPVTSKPSRVEVVPEPPADAGRLEGLEPSIVDRMAAGQTVIVTELDPPKTLDIEKFLTGAQALVAAGTDSVTLADNSLAVLRVSNLAMGAMLKHRYNVMPLLHVSCRDRNILGLQSELMGMAAMGIRHVLPLTGDPAKVGDHPGASSVYDVNSVQLIQIIRRLNEGFNHIGKSIKVPTSFVIGCTFNPNAKNMEAQVKRLERKVAAGAQYVMTQPVFDTALVAEMEKCTRHIGIPILTGVWPLLSGRQAEFLHNEVPGIVIPDRVRAAMAGREGPEARRMGVEIAKEVCRAILDLFPGVYLITPFLNYETTVELSRFVRDRS
jgi:methionine synthase I (cobalamin-dependent)/5,10-methylenetetrahydrofolate reductase